MDIHITFQAFPDGLLEIIPEIREFLEKLNENEFVEGVEININEEVK